MWLWDTLHWRPGPDAKLDFFQFFHVLPVLLWIDPLLGCELLVWYLSRAHVSGSIAPPLRKPWREASLVAFGWYAEVLLQYVLDKTYAFLHAVETSNKSWWPRSCTNSYCSCFFFHNSLGISSHQSPPRSSFATPRFKVHCEGCSSLGAWLIVVSWASAASSLVVHATCPRRCGRAPERSVFW